MASKYKDVMKNLDPLPVEDTNYQSKVQTLKEGIGEHDPEILADLYESTKRGEFVGDRTEFIESLQPAIELLGKEGLEEILYRVNMRLAALEQLLISSYEKEDEGWGMYGATPTMIRMKNGGSVSVQPEPVGKVLDKEAFRLWCINNGLEHSLQLWPTTANAIAKERYVNGEPDPDGMKTYSRMKVVLRKGGS